MVIFASYGFWAPALGWRHSVAVVACLLYGDVCMASTLTVGDAAAGDNFGWSVAVDGDTAVVGAPLHDLAAGDDQGAAYVFVHDGAGWVEQGQLTASDAGNVDFLGWSVAIGGDTVVVGAPSDNGLAGPNQGAAYVFIRNGSGWSQQAKLVPNDAVFGDFFGISVAIEGDTAVIGAYLDENAAGPEQGSAYVFTRSGVVWSQQTKLVPDDAAYFDHFGYTVALNGGTAVIGAPWDEDAAGFGQGAVYVYTGSGAVWTQQAKLFADDATETAYLGSAVAILGDTIVAGAPSAIVSGGVRGAAYAFERNGSVWQQQPRLVAPDGAVGDKFGSAIALVDEGVAIGAPGVNGPAGADQGAAYLFSRGGSPWSYDTTLIASDGAAEDRLGFSVALTADGVLGGAPYADDLAGADQGAVSVFALTALVNIASANPPTANPFVGGPPQAFTDVLQTGNIATGVTQGIGAVNTPVEDTVNYATISITFDTVPATPPTAAATLVACTPSAYVCPSVVALVGTGAGPYVLSLSGAIPPTACTTMTFPGTAAAGQKLQYRYLPGDANYSGSVSALDVQVTVIALGNGTAQLPQNRPRFDFNRSGVVTNSDLLRQIGLLNGLNTTQAWTGAVAAACP